MTIVLYYEFVFGMRTNRLAILFCASLELALGQSPTGSMAGVVRDESGSAVASAKLTVRSTTTGLTRMVDASVEGDYGFPDLLAGAYELSAEAAGFKRGVRLAQVATGVTTTADFVLSIGDTTDSVTAEGSLPQMHYDSPAVNGLVTGDQINDLPLNGRNFLELEKLEPGGQPPTRQNNNRVLAPVLDAPSGNSGRGTRVTVDGTSIMSIGYAGVGMGFSQEVVQEFQISMVEFDLAAGAGDMGSINIITRSGGNQLRGSAFYFFRDHLMAAYPALNRDSKDPNPFFERQQFGLSAGGPIRPNKIFYFGSWERNDQRGVSSSTFLTPEFAPFSGITPTPFYGDQISFRVDAQMSKTQTLFIRQSHDGNRGFSPDIMAQLSAYPSGWHHQTAWVDQSVVGLTSILRPTLVNDLRLAYLFTSSRDEGAQQQDCPQCLGIGEMQINIPQAGFSIGNSTNAYDLARQFEIMDSVTWQLGKHRVRFGTDWEYHGGGNTTYINDPATITLFSPAQSRQYSIPLPPSFATLNDILQLPLQSVTIAVGSPVVPEAGGGTIRRWITADPYVQDIWRISKRLTLNYGLGWNLDRDLNYDLRKPPLLAPVLGADNLGPTRKQWRNFSPVMGLAWAPFGEKTVIRAGTGIFYDQMISPELDPERALLGPPGFGLQTFSGTSILNPLAGVPGVPLGKALNFPATPTQFSGADLLSILPAIRANLSQSLSTADQNIQAIQLSKQASSSGVFPANYSGPGSAFESTAGIQHEIARDWVVSADIAYRHFIHLDLGGAGMAGIDLNHYNSVLGPVIPVCTSTQMADPTAICSSGPIDVHVAPARATYKGLLVRAEKRYSHGLQLLGAYAYSSTVANNAGNGLNLLNWLQNRGPTATDLTHILNIEAVKELPWHFVLSLEFSFSSAPPFSAYVGGIDFNGDGTQGDLLPGTTVNAFNRGTGHDQLQRLVNQFNQTYTGTLVNGRLVPRLVLPANYAFNDSLQSLDFRLSRTFVFWDCWRATLIGEAFNLYNAANLTGYSGDLTNPATFGQPTTRATQVFGSGGPRAFQLAMRVSF